MTQSKREPFATYRPYSRGLMADGFVDGKQYAYLSVAEAKHQIQTINAAFNARVDEEVKEAVEESEKWRRAAILLGERIGTVGPNGYYSFTADQFFEWVKGLPTEPKP